MNHQVSPLAVSIFLLFVGAVLGLSFWLGRRTRSAQAYYAAHGQVPWFVNGIAFAGDYLSAASFLGICGMIAFFGYDGFLYSIGYLAGWIVALFVIAEPLKRLGRYTLADALDSRFQSKGIKLSAAISTLVVSIFYLIPQMVGAGSLITPLLGLPHVYGVLMVGATVTVIVATAGMVSTTWVQFLKGGLLVIFCAILAMMILARGLGTTPPAGTATGSPSEEATVLASGERLPLDSAWAATAQRSYLRIRMDDETIVTWRKDAGDGLWRRCQTVTTEADKPALVDGRQDLSLRPVGRVLELSGTAESTGPLDPAGYFAALQSARIETWRNEKVIHGTTTTMVFFPVEQSGSDLLAPGGTATFAGLRKPLPAVDPARPESVLERRAALLSRIDFLSLMLALFCGTASLPHILIRYYTVKDAASARKSTVVGIAAIGFFYVLTLILGLGAMTSGALDPSDSNMSAPLLARSFGELPFAIISAIAFTTVLGTVSGLIMAASGAIVHDLMGRLLGRDLDDTQKVRAGKIAAVGVGLIAMWLGVQFQAMNVTFLVGWAFNIAASANLPALLMLLFWRGTTKQGITWSILIGMIASLAWVLLSKEAFQHVYGQTAAAAAANAPVPFSQPAIVTIPLGFAVLVLVSLATRRRLTSV